MVACFTAGATATKSSYNMASRRPRLASTAWKPTIGSMDQQLIIKFYRPSLTDEAFLATIEADLKAALGDAVVLEGFDVSAKEINLFMTTADPRQAWRRAKDVIEKLGVERGLSAASRLVGGAKFTSLWPPRATRKFKLP